MKIKSGGQTDSLKDKIKEIRITSSSNRKFELWINECSLSYLTIDELLDLRDEINAALKKVL